MNEDEIRYASCIAHRIQSFYMRYKTGIVAKSKYTYKLEKDA